ncbi:WD40 repeat domain-containing protein [Saccharopolyspora sp. 5N708]|uniref:WD40 repeat domain-containing protein n=1 Tax=Saccharopolyspora sp. 5N708 TaxID=3457424 RepID=UPI003FD0FC1E
MADLDRQQNSSRRSLLRWRISTAVVSVLALVLAIVAYTNNVQLNDRIQSANAVSLAEESNRLAGLDELQDHVADVNPTDALQLALAAYREKPDSPEAYGALLRQRLYWLGVDRLPADPLLRNVNTLRSSADGKVVAFASWDASTITIWWNLPGPDTRHREIRTESGAFSLSPDGRWLAATGESGLQVWDLSRPGDPIVLGSDGVFGEPTFSANSRYLSAGARFSLEREGEPQHIRAWDVQTGQEVQSGAQTPIMADNPRYQPYVSPDGMLLTSTEPTPDTDSGIAAVVRELSTNRVLRSFPLSEDQGTSPSILSNGTRIIGCVGNTATIYDAYSGSVQHSFPISDDCSYNVDDAGQYLLPSSDESPYQPIGAIRLDTGRWFDFGDSPAPVSWGDSPVVLIPGDNEVLTAISIRQSVSDRAGVVQVSQVAARLGPIPRLPRADILTQSSDGRLWAAYTYWYEDERLELALLDANGAVLNILPVPQSPDALGFDITGERLFVVTDNIVSIFRTDGLTFEREVQLPTPTMSGIGDERTASVTATSDGSIFIGQFGTLSKWNPNTGRQIGRAVTVTPAQTGSLAPQGPLTSRRPGHPDQLIVRAEEELSILDIRSQTRLSSTVLEDMYASLWDSDTMTSPDGSTAAMETGTIGLVDLDEMRVLPVLQSPDQEDEELVGFSGNYLFTTTEEQVHIWRWDQSRLIASIKKEAEPAIDGSNFFPNGFPGYRKPLSLDPEEWFRDLCRLSNRDFTEQELRLLPEGVSHDRPCDR